MKLLNPPVKYRTSFRYKYTLTEDAHFRIGKLLKQGQASDAWGRVFMSWVGDRLTIHKGYAWDGATCWFDSADNMAATLLHDALYQLSSASNSPFTRAESDRYFRQLQSSRFQAHLTYLGVRLFGSFFWGNAPADLHITYAP